MPTLEYLLAVIRNEGKFLTADHPLTIGDLERIVETALEKQVAADSQLEDYT